MSLLSQIVGASTFLTALGGLVVFPTGNLFINQFHYEQSGQKSTDSGSINYGGFGGTLTSAGDVNYDGYDDVIIGAQDRAYLFLGSPTGLKGVPNKVFTGDEKESLGCSVASAGDINNDGFSDVLIGSYGKVRVYLGSLQGLVDSPILLTLDNNEDDAFGSVSAAAGDINQDGYDDVLVGASGADMSTGKVYIYLGTADGLALKPSKILTGEETGDDFGCSVAPAGDVNHDGFADVIIGASSASRASGRAYLYLGGEEGLSDTPSFIINGEGPVRYLGNSVASAGDVDHDGFDDILVGASGGNGIHGKVFLYMGSTTGIKSSPAVAFESSESDDRFGTAVSSAGDINKDGFQDIIIGASRAVSADVKGRAYIYLGSKTGLRDSPENTFSGKLNHDGFGRAVASAGDINHDGFSDILIGAGSHKYIPSEHLVSGKVYVYRGGIKGLSSMPNEIVSGERNNK